MSAARILIVDDDRDFIDVEREMLAEAGFSVEAAMSAEEAGNHLNRNYFDLLILDERMKGLSGTRFLQECNERYPGIGAIFLTGYADVACATRAIRAGALDLLQKPVGGSELVDAVQRALQLSQLARSQRYRAFLDQQAVSLPEIVGESAPLRDVLALVRQVAATSATVLIQGETGTGKELVARAIHSLSLRASARFVALNVAAVTPTLVESILFGHERGSFTGAHQRQIGLFEAAHGGSIFLDEIGDMPLELQPRLLRVLQEHRIQRIGSIAEIPVNVRVIAATHRDLTAEVAAGRLREDLFFRLNVFPVRVPPLRDRKDDIAALALHFLHVHGADMKRPIRRIHPDALRQLCSHQWPGNIRELSNAMESAVIRCSGDEIRPEHLVITQFSSPRSEPDFGDAQFREAQEVFERRYFQSLLRRASDNKAEAARLAGLDRSVFYAHLKKLELI
jgi:two-component system, NtrC family, response regulator HydG